ncbi:hypothetical protein CR513_02159 [Mucuna pruriens]|uniref:Uncharacterized protein n=1 Tax=Mucuna pruriens TaxID=157652 RepID=A0A371IDB1_MUCPR|nr:hypothetical protein CR513_02159 [Mucuna pruriens]
MASVLCKSAVRVASRSFTNRSRSFVQSSTTPFAFSSSSSSSTRIPRASRVLSVVISVDSLMPLHSAIANARLTSNIAFDSTCWSSLSRGLLDPSKMKEKMKERIKSFLFSLTLGWEKIVKHLNSGQLYCDSLKLQTCIIEFPLCLRIDDQLAHSYTFPQILLNGFGRINNKMHAYLRIL